MQEIIAFLVLILFLSGIILIYKYPQISLALYISLYGAEQVLYTTFPYFVAHSTFYNFSVGAMGALAMLISVVKYGMPALLNKAVVIFVVFFCLTWASTLWTRAPIAANYAVIHFSTEATLGFFLPFFVIRKEEDLSVVAIYVILFSVLISLMLIVSPKAGIGGRVLLVEGGSVLAPATMTGTGIIFIASMKKQMLGFLYYFKYLFILILMVGCFLSGARAQFYISVFIALVLMFSGQKKFKTIMVVSIVSFISVGVISTLLPDDIINSIINVSTRYGTGAFDKGIDERLSMFESAFTLDGFLFGHGLMGWAYQTTGRDIYVYPHNSLAQVYFELGIIGLFLFIFLIGIGLTRGWKAYKLNKKNNSDSKLVAIFLGYLVYGTLLSLKQFSFTSCNEVYIGVSVLSILYFLARKRARSQKRVS